ncbi:uncharacterized protein LOC121257421 isoform X2 [Juglans microcarpa x Juglans regia]|uniref:uncharacterized protein LOC121257421 isoform X2 n=1 Tax=Juglans microcarpa x Juglans regia TaxID=2249226 RepID=UPI001B7F2525|nr:uncharacterized protein LOC121257421 isoform X2 [Juglans microcarpa x Juglans regia]
MSTMEEQVKKIKTKATNKKKDKGKSRLRCRLDTELLESSENQLGLSGMRMQENVQTPTMVNEESGQHPVIETQESGQHPVIGTQESMQLGMDGTQPEMADGTQPSSFL